MAKPTAQFLTDFRRRLIVVVSGVRAAFGELPRRRVIWTALAAVILIGIAFVVPVPSALQLRDWARALGPWFPVAFLVAHSLVTVLPFPRTAFTLAAGLLFGSALGIVLAIVASTVSAVIALILVRVFGWQLAHLIKNPAVENVNNHLRRRGWLAVLSLRLIPMVPFSVINYAAGASSVRLLPYVGATVIGLLPGTAAVVVLGDALTGQISPMLALVSVCTACVGVAGLGYEIRSHRRRAQAAVSG